MTPQPILHIGLDDTDSTKGGCTTYLTAILVKKLEKFNVKFIDYPRLIRLNPNVPWKTRGNGALSLSFNYEAEFEEEIKDAALALWEQYSALEEKGTDPGIVFYKSAEIPTELKAFAKKTETAIVTIKEALKLIKRLGAEASGFNSCRGIIGALAAIGETLEGDHTFELIAYRMPENVGTKRKVDEASIFHMDEVTQPFTFNNVDIEKRRVIITPRGPDPILLGIRGETPDIVKKAFSLIKPLEPVERWVIFRSNQGTDAHLKRIDALSKVEPYRSIVAKGIISKNPKIIPLRHVIFSIKDETSEVDCAAYEPTGDLRKVARELTIGDTVEVYGATHKAAATKPLTINLEKINIVSLQSKTMLENPICPNCGKRLKSMGKHQGFRCEKCGSKFSHLEKLERAVPRMIKEGLYVTSTRSQRHLTKPLRRYGQEKKGSVGQSLISMWHSPLESLG
ncbi:MAG: tRNA(Ile)(2)-agmatinylcytidine synthase [Candidatus Bathyarchaeota archaeon]|nr:tRNA(Ile)(2)-agmatinylcytidine synthase [Candidatus Bathyarchaeota archaeon]